MEKVTDRAFIEEMMAEYPDLLTEEIFGENIRFALEGYLYPATYPFYEENPTFEEIIKMMLTATNNVVLEYSSLA